MKLIRIKPTKVKFSRQWVVWWVVLAVLILAVSGMLYSLEWTRLLGEVAKPLIKCSSGNYCYIKNHTLHKAPKWAVHKSFTWWITPGDLWGTLRATQYVVWGYFGGVYTTGAPLVVFPGILLILAPAVWLSQTLGLNFSYPFAIPNPTAWLIIGPYEMLIGSLPLFALDALAKRLGISTARRVVLTFLEMAALWPLLVIWGHPEDALAVGIGLYGLMAAYDKRHVKAGWLFGIAISIQPLVGLIFPIIFGLTEKRHWLSLGIRGVLPSFALLVVPIISSPRSTLRAILQQPNYPTIDHPTPWVYLSPKISLVTPSHIKPSHIKHISDIHHAEKTALISHTASVIHRITGHLPLVVSAGPTRIFAIIAAFTIGYWILRHHPGLILVLWLAGLSFAARCFFESVIDPYYFWPAIGLGILVAAQSSRIRFALAALFAAALAVFSYWHFNPWVYWLLMMVLLSGVLATGIPSVNSADVGISGLMEIKETEN